MFGASLSVSVCNAADDKDSGAAADTNAVRRQASSNNRAHPSDAHRTYPFTSFDPSHTAIAASGGYSMNEHAPRKLFSRARHEISDLDAFVPPSRHPSSMHPTPTPTPTPRLAKANQPASNHWTGFRTSTLPSTCTLAISLLTASPNLHAPRRLSRSRFVPRSHRGPVRPHLHVHVRRKAKQPTDAGARKKKKEVGRARL
jgi:hypothetical protein